LPAAPVVPGAAAVQAALVWKAAARLPGPGHSAVPAAGAAAEPEMGSAPPPVPELVLQALPLFRRYQGPAPGPGFDLSRTGHQAADLSAVPSASGPMIHPQRTARQGSPRPWLGQNRKESTGKESGRLSD
ncbi:MAG TPA: hypothetical protein VKF36_21440, partial [Syntrophorhabdales bacterium]|nr:hypothetical protein [Syntrophorhabdales bacterium]